MPTDPAHARLRLRNLVAGLIASTSPTEAFTDAVKGLGPNPTVDELLALLDASAAADLEVVVAALDDRPTSPRFVWAVTEYDRRFGHPRVVVLIDLLNADADNGHQATFVAEAVDSAKARSIAAVLNEHPPVEATPAYDEEPF